MGYLKEDGSALKEYRNVIPGEEVVMILSLKNIMLLNCISSG
jgi:hypothetical protein